MLKEKNNYESNIKTERIIKKVFRKILLPIKKMT